MNLLLDTCTFLWWIADAPSLNNKVKAALSDEHNRCSLSVASVWEILVKHAAGKLQIDSGTQTVFDFLCELCAASQFELLPLQGREVRHVSTLPDLHHDPFDRLLICQAIEHGLTLVTPDPWIQRYPIKTLWG